MAKPLAIVYGHASRDVGILSVICYSFHVPLCVFLTGYLSRYKGISLKDQLKRSVYRLLLPYFLWSLISMGIYMILGKLASGSLGRETYTLGENIYYMLRGQSIGNAPLWYLPFLFNIQLLFYFWLRFLKKKQPVSRGQKITVILLPAFFSILTLSIYSRYRRDYPLDLPFNIGNACFLFVFLWFGFLAARFMKLPQGKRWLPAAALLISVSVTAAVLLNDEVEYMSFDHQNYGRNIGVFYVTAMISSVGIIWLFQNLGSCRLLQWFGRNSMAIFLMHKFPVLFFQLILGDLSGVPESLATVIYLLNAVLSMVMCCVAGLILRKILPCMLGEKRK